MPSEMINEPGLPARREQGLWGSGSTWRRLARVIFIMAAVFVTAEALAIQSLELTPEEQAWLKNNPEKLILYHNREFPPIEFTSRDGRFSGLSADMIRLIEERLGITFIKIPVDENQTPYDFLGRHESALAPAMVKTTERERYTLFTKPYLSLPLVLISHQADQERLALDDFEGSRIAAVSGFAAESLLRHLGGRNIEIVPVSNALEGLVMVSMGQVDAIFENLDVASYYVEKTGIDNLAVACDLNRSVGLRIGVNRDYPLLYSAIGKVLDSMDEKELKALRNRWGHGALQGVLSRDTVRLIKLVALFTILLVSGLAIISYVLKRRLNREIKLLKQTQSEVVDQSELIRLALESTRAGVWEYYPKHKKGRLSEHWNIILGDSDWRNLDIKEWMALVHPDDIGTASSVFNEYLEKGCPGLFESEFRVRTPGGSWVWVLSTGRCSAWDEAGKPERVIGLSINVQHLKEIQESLANSEARFRALFENAPYGIVIHDMKGQYLDANKSFLESRGVTKEQLLALHSQDMARVPDEEVHDAMRILFEQGVIRNREAIVTRHDGRKINVIYSSALLEIEGQKQILSISIDVTDRKNAEKALKESEEKFRTLFKFSPLPLGIVDLKGRFIEVNDRFIRVLGYTLADLRDLDDWWLKAYPDPEYRERVKETWISALEKAPETGNLIEAGEFRVTCKYGTERNMVISGAVIGNMTLGSFFDITDRKKAEQEREQLQVQLNQAQKLEAVGVLAGGVAHDFNNMLGTIIGYAEMLLSDMEPEQEERAPVGEILDAANRSAGLTRQLLAFARKQAVEPVALDLNASVNDILKMLGRLIGENITLDWKPSDDPCIVLMDPTQLDQILANLCVNAGDAIDNMGRITIETETVSIDEDYCRCYPDFIPGEYVLLSVSDDGAGMEKETLDHIFDPFFTTKGLGKGTGLGLATVYGIIRQSDGFIHVYSEVGEGTTFRLYFPRKDTTNVTTLSPASKSPLKSHGESIVFVEDDPSLNKMGEMMLGRLGYAVMATQSPEEAIRIAGDTAISIDLFIMDVVMPEMNGWDLAEHLNRIRPDIPCLFMSGYSSHTILKKGPHGTGMAFIQKPFTLSDLGQKIRDVLDKGKPADQAGV